MSAKTEVKLSRVGYIMMPVRDLARSLAFYRDALGLSVRFAGEEFAFLDGGGVAVALRKAASTCGFSALLGGVVTRPASSAP